MKNKIVSLYLKAWIYVETHNGPVSWLLYQALWKLEGTKALKSILAQAQKEYGRNELNTEFSEA